MLSYRHAFHVGNHADVLKHVVLVQLLRHLTRKDKPLLFADTHAGAGMYSLEHGYAARNAEFASGIGRLWSHPALPDLVADYVAAVRMVNPDGVLRHYPGSPQLAAQVLRPQDRLQLFELHSTDSEILAAHFREGGRRVVVNAGDGFSGLKAVLPPPSRRGLVLLDPSYELGDDYRAVGSALTEALRRFATGTYVIWYPQLARREAVQLPARLLRLAAAGDWLHVALRVKTPSPDGFGLHGSGLFVLNPPWKAAAELEAVMPFLTDVLGQDSGAHFQLEYRES
ncbi:MAG: 23S rRNA (adenine(2030)-N(6))-methyltransferase RlmJ [Casimicrobiaceae bacterium]